MQSTGPTGSSRATFWLKRVALLALLAIAAINVWTGAPVLALWIGSQAQAATGAPAGSTTVDSLLVVVVSLVVIECALAAAISALSAAHDRLTGRPRRKREPLPWNRSMRDTAPGPSERSPLTATERIMVAMLVAGVLAAEILFFFTHPALR